MSKRHRDRNKSIVIWGAGKIGRGFVAELFYNAGYDVSFVDANNELVKGLKNANSYTVLKLRNNSSAKTIIKGFDIYNTDDSEVENKILNAELLAIVVFPGVFEQVAEKLAPIIEKMACQDNKDSFLNILMCTNTLHPAENFKSILLNKLSEKAIMYADKKIGFVNTLIMCMAVEPTEEQKREDPYIVVTNGYPEMSVDKTAFKGPIPEIPGIIYTEKMKAEECRKFYTYNMLHAVYAYLGSRKGYEYVAECTQDEEVQQLAIKTLEEVSDALIREFGFTQSEMEEWNNRVLENMANPILKDKLDRVGADPIRKLSRNDRLVGPALLCRNNGLMPYYLSKAIAYGFLYYNDKDASSIEINSFLKIYGIKEAVKKYCGLDKEFELIELICRHFKKAIEDDGVISEDFKRVAVIKKAYERGFYYEKSIKGCAQCTIAALSDITGCLDEKLFKAASGLSGGIAITGDGSCGGYTGGVLYMGTHAGRRWDRIPVDGDKIEQYKSYEMAQKLHDKYIEIYGTVTCKDIHQKIFGEAFCLRTQEGRDKFEQAGAHKDKCTSVIGTACSLVAEILLDEGYIKY